MRDVRNDVHQVLYEVDARPPDGTPLGFLQPAVHEGDGVTINTAPDDGGLILLAGFFERGNQLRLIRRDGEVVARWPVSFSKLFPDTDHLVKPPQTDWNVDIHGALIHPDGSVVFNFEYGGAVKLSRCGEVLWRLEHPTHHSMSLADGGGYWIPGRVVHPGDDPPPLPPFTRLPFDASHERGYAEDQLLRVSADGEILEQVSVPRLLYRNGLKSLLTANGEWFDDDMPWDHEFVHLNAIDELTPGMAAAFPAFEAGDLLISIKNYNLLVVVDPDDWRVKWHQTGPWERQHDPHFLADGTISVFNNNAYRLALDSRYRTNPEAPRTSSVLKLNPASGKVAEAVGKAAGQPFLSHIRGKSQPLEEGGFMVTEFEGGRAFEVDGRGEVVWSYVNRYDADEVAEITGANLYPASYFTVTNWSCPAPSDS